MIFAAEKNTWDPIQAAAFFGVSRKTVYEWAKPTRKTKQGEEQKNFWLETLRDGTRWRTTPEMCQRFRERCSQQQLRDQFMMSLPMGSTDQTRRIAEANMRVKDKHGIQ